MAENCISIASNRIPFFDGSNFPYWKCRMETYIKATDFTSWEIIQYGDKELALGDSPILTDEDKKKLELNHSAKNLILMSISHSVFAMISSCETAKDIWDKLCETYEGAAMIKDTRRGALMQDYELFRFKNGETISDGFDRFTLITNELALLGKRFDDSELVRKILRILPSTWDSKTNAIEEAHDLDKLTLSQLREKLQAYESKLKHQYEQEKGKKSIAFKASVEKEPESDKDSESEEEDDDDVTLLARKLSRLINRKKGKFPNRNKVLTTDKFKYDVGKIFKEKEEKKEKKKEKKEIICFECKKPGHIKYACPVLIKKMEKYKKKQKALMATWSDLDESEAESEDMSEDTEEANICLMASSEVTSDSDEEEIPESIRSQIKKLLKALSKANEKIEALKDEKEALTQTNQLLVDENDILTCDIEVLQIDVENLRLSQDSLEKENCTLREEIKGLKIRIDSLSKEISSTFSKFSESDEKLEKLISFQRVGQEKTGLGYQKGESSKTPTKTIFVKSKESKGKEPIVNNKFHMNTTSTVQNKGYIRRYPQQMYQYPVKKYFRRSVRSYNRRYSVPNHGKPVRTNTYACFFCNKVGHIEKFCYYKNYKLSNQQVRNLNSTSLKFGGPKLVWVPKRT